MTECHDLERIEAYHDGQLDAAAGAEVRRHLDTCDRCSAVLTEIRATSRVFAEAPAPRLSQIGLHRLHAHVEMLFDRGLVRLARVMTGIAAAVVVAGSLWLMRSNAPTPVAGSVTQMALQIEEQSPAVASESSPSDWIVAELSQ